MPDSLIAQVKRLAEAQGDGTKWVKIEFPKIVWGTVFDFPALLAHMQAQQAVVDAARELRKLGPLAGGSLRASIAAVETAVIALDAALENLRSDNDGK